jgi:hypothetical protein
MLIENADGSLRQSVFLLVHLGQQTIATDKGNLHAREKGRENHRDNQSYDE